MSKVSIGKEASVFDVLKVIGRPVQEQLVSSVMGFVGADYAFYKAVEKEVGQDKAKDIYCKLWEGYVGAWAKGAMEAIGITEVKDIPTLGRIARFVYDDILCPLKPVIDTQDRYVGLILLCPFVDHTVNMFGEKFGCSYHQALAKSCSNFVAKMAEFLGLKDVIGKQDKFMCLGDDVCRITYERRG